MVNFTNPGILGDATNFRWYYEVIYFILYSLIQRIRLMIFEKLVHMEVGWFDEPGHSSGAIGARLSADAATIRGLVGDALGLLVQNIGSAVAALLIAFLASWQLAFNTNCKISGKNAIFFNFSTYLQLLSRPIFLTFSYNFLTHLLNPPVDQSSLISLRPSRSIPNNMKHSWTTLSHTQAKHTKSKLVRFAFLTFFLLL